MKFYVNFIVVVIVVIDVIIVILILIKLVIVIIFICFLWKNIENDDRKRMMIQFSKSKPL